MAGNDSFDISDDDGQSFVLTPMKDGKRNGARFEKRWDELTPEQAASVRALKLQKGAAASGSIVPNDAQALEAAQLAEEHISGRRTQPEIAPIPTYAESGASATGAPTDEEIAADMPPNVRDSFLQASKDQKDPDVQAWRGVTDAAGKVVSGVQKYTNPNTYLDYYKNAAAAILEPPVRGAMKGMGFDPGPESPELSARRAKEAAAKPMTDEELAGSMPQVQASELTFADHQDEADVHTDPLEDMTAALERQKRGLTMSSEASQPIVASAAQKIQELTTTNDEVLDDAQRAEKAAIGQYQNTLDMLKSKGQIDPGRVWKRGGGSVKILAAVAVALGQIGAHRRGGSNPALQMIEKITDDDIAAQQAELAKNQAILGDTRNLVGMWDGVLKNRQAAILAAKASLLENAKLLVASKTAPGTLEIALGGLDEKIAAAKLAMAQAMAKKGGGKVLPSGATGELGEIRAAKNMMGDLSKAFDYMNGWGPAWAWLTKKIPNMASNVYSNTEAKALVEALIKGLGANPSDRDRAFVEQQTPMPGDTEATKRSKIQALANRYSMLYNEKLSAYRAAKYDVSEFEGLPSEKSIGSFEEGGIE